MLKFSLEKGNTVTPPITISLQKVAEGQFKATAHTGAPFNIVLPLSATSGSIGTPAVTIPKGALESATLTVVRTSGTTSAVTVDIGTLPGLPTDRPVFGSFSLDNYPHHQGYTLVKSADLPLEVIAAVQ